MLECLRFTLKLQTLLICLILLYCTYESYLGYVNSSTATFKLDYCNCERTLEIDPTLDESLFNQTTCSRAAFLRGSHQKVIGFSFYGDPSSSSHQGKNYFKGIKENLEDLRKFYPGWIMRLYFDLSLEDPILEDICNLACQDSNLDLCNAGSLPGTPMVDARKVFAMIWRFFPTIDPQVDLYLCRDLDSRYSARELAAVNEWLASGQPIHAMRDHPLHGTPLLGASWDANTSEDKIRENWRWSWKNILNDSLTYSPRNIKGPDQTVIANHVWSWGKNMSMQHDAYLCEQYPGSIGWPTQRLRGPSNFVGSVLEEEKELWKDCPESCRREGHPDWKQC